MDSAEEFFTLEKSSKFQLPLGEQKLLDQQVTGCKQNTPTPVDELLTDGTEQVRLTAARIAKKSLFR